MTLYLFILIPLLFTTYSMYWAIVKVDKKFSKEFKVIKGLQLLNLVSLASALIFLLIQAIVHSSWIRNSGDFLQFNAIKFIIISVILKIWNYKSKRKVEN
ncbi:MAG: hypothetical protein K1060chlam5_01352 [Candidatus Anoxychlamydiales bacterium]|nr:hypothetical protein [Candidatus Anoxychlamydiales bacterium]